MTKTVEEVRRAAFEAVAPKLIGASFLAEYDLYRNELGEYHYNPAAYYWKAFNAALDAVEIQLPGPSAAMASVFDYQHSTRNKNVTGTTNWAANVGMVVVDDCRAAIEQTGLGLRVK